MTDKHTNIEASRLVAELVGFQEKQELTNEQMVKELQRVGLKLPKRTYDNWRCGTNLPRSATLLGVRTALESLRGSEQAKPAKRAKKLAVEQPAASTESGS